MWMPSLCYQSDGQGLFRKICRHISIFIIQDIVCSTPEEISCSQLEDISYQCLRFNKTQKIIIKIKDNIWNLFRQCSGLSLTSFIKYESSKMFEQIHASTIEKYLKYKRITSTYDENYKSKTTTLTLSVL